VGEGFFMYRFTRVVPHKGRQTVVCVYIVLLYRQVSCLVPFTYLCGLWLKAERRIFTNFHRQVFCWTDLWHGLTMSDIRAIEEKTKHELDEV